MQNQKITDTKEKWLKFIKIKIFCSAKISIRESKRRGAGPCLSLILALRRQLQLDPWDFRAVVVYLELQGNMVRSYLRKETSKKQGKDS